MGAIITNVLIKSQGNATHDFIHYQSNWKKLIRAVAWLLKLKDVLLHLSHKRREIIAGMNTKTSDELEKKRPVGKKNENSKTMHEDTTPHIKCAEKDIIRVTQLEEFPGEIQSLRTDAHRSSRSHIRKLDPFLQDKLLRTGGRLSQMAMPENRKHPVILPKHHHISKLVMKHIHEQLGHCGRNHMLAKLRQQYWIPATNSLARKIHSECAFCRRSHSHLGESGVSNSNLKNFHLSYH